MRGVSLILFSVCVPSGSSGRFVLFCCVYKFSHVSGSRLLRRCLFVVHPNFINIILLNVFALFCSGLFYSVLFSCSIVLFVVTNVLLFVVGVNIFL